jgi:hypothetical protein
MVSLWCMTPLWALLMIDHGFVARGELLCFGMRQSRVKCPNFPQLKHVKLWLGACCGGLTIACCSNGVGAQLNCYCCCWYYRWLPQYDYYWGRCSWPPGGVYTMQYIGGAPLEPPLVEDLGIILFLFFSSASAMTFIVLSWSMASLANSL